MSLIAVLAIIAVAPICIWMYFRPELVLHGRGILRRLLRKTDSDINSVSDEIKRWIIVGVCLNKVLTPALRNVIATEIPKWYNALCQPPTEIHKQVHGRHKIQLNPSTLDLNYKNINNNHVHRSPRLFDYKVKDPLSLAKLFVQPFMSKFTGFDQTMDVSAVLSVIGEAAPFAGAAAHAKKVRSDIRNEWAHCNPANWTEGKFKTDFQTMEKLLKNVKLSSEDEQKLCDELNVWKELQLCFGQAVDVKMLSALQDQVGELCQAVKTWNLGKEEMSELFSKITEVLFELSRFNIKEEERIPYAFTAPPRNRYFSGRNEEIQELKRILKVEETIKEKKVSVAAVCGLGGIGKTSLVSEYAHQMKDFYKGGVYWFSGEDDKFLDKTMNDVALKIGVSLGSFDSTMSSILKKISSSSDPSLIVVDCVDQLELSLNMKDFLSFPSQENIFGHFVILTRRNPNLLINDVSVLQDNSCLQLKCFKSAEAKQFLLSRSGKARDDNIAEYLCEELGGLPLALEQAGAYIQIRRCSLSSYLEQYKAEHLRLLGKQRSRPVSPGKQLPERLAVHTTWLLNLEYMKKSPDGPAAVRFMNACSFFNGNEIEEELINIGTPEVEDDEYRKCVSSPLGRCEILKLLTDFSLFTYVQAHSVRTHRLVQELVRENFDPKSKAESFTDAVRMLSYAFSKCPSPGNLVSSNEINGKEQSCIFATNLPNSPSYFHMWSKFCMHGHQLRNEIEDLLVSLDSDEFLQTSTILYECAVHLSANHKQEEAKRALNFAYRMLDWPSLSKYGTVEKIVSSNSSFPLSIPLPKSIQMAIKGCCMPPFPSLQSLTAAPESSRFDLERETEKLKSDGNESYKEGRHEEALNAYSAAIKMANDCNNASFNPVLLTNRASVYVKLKKYDDALKDANDYIVRRPDCCKGYARKALALHGLNEKKNAEIAAALAFYHNRAIFSGFSPFKESFATLQERIFICDSVDELQEAIISQDVKDELKILVLGSEEYILRFDTVHQPWDNCVLVGTRKDRSVSLKSDNGIALLKCGLTNLSFYFSKGCVCCIPGSFVKTLNCNFVTSNYAKVPAVITKGNLNAEQCNFTSVYGSGLVCVGPGNSVVVECAFFNNGNVGVGVNQGATLLVQRCRIYGNYHGLHVKNSESKCVVICCDVCHNCAAGIFIVNSKHVKLMRNNVFGNEVGTFAVNSEIEMEENNVFDNALWGIWFQSNSWCNILMNRVFRNKAGGVRVGFRAERFSPCVIEKNKVYDNTGPGLLEILNDFEISQSAYGLNEDLRKTCKKSPNSLIRAKFQDNEKTNNKELGEMIEKLNLSVLFCSNCRKKCDPKMCEKCFATAYCSSLCQNEHLSKHKRICKVLRQKSSYIISSTERPKSCDYAVEDVEVHKDTRKKSRFRLPRNGRRFVVKVRSVLTKDTSYRLMLYDYNFRLHKTFNSKFIDELVKEFGVLCDRKCLEKKLYFYCMFEAEGQLRLFTNEFPEFQSWCAHKLLDTFLLWKILPEHDTTKNEFYSSHFEIFY